METPVLLLLGLGAAVLLSRRKDSKIVLTKPVFTFPLNGKINSGFGMRVNPFTGEKKLHNGVDIAGKIGDKIRCPFSGVVSKIYFNEIGGNQLIINHSNGFITGYAHLNKIYVSAGSNVSSGQIIAEVGNTGKVTGPHLHFSLRDQSGNYLDPLKYFV